MKPVRAAARTLRKSWWNAYTLWHARGEARLPYRPLDEILAIQSRRVRAIVGHAYENVPHYREVMRREGLHPGDFHTAEDLALLPIVTGAEMARAPERFLAVDYSPGDGLGILSSGTSGRAKTVHYDAAALFLALAHGHRQRVVLARFVGRRFGYREMSAIRSEAAGVQIRAFYEARSWVPKNVDFERSILPPKGSVEEAVARINAFRPDVLRGYGSHLGALFRGVSERGLPLARPKAVVYGADRMIDADRHLIETEFGVPVLSTYQAVEALRIGYQCERRESFHVALDQVAVRVVDENGAEVGPGGSGEIVTSNLTNRATVVLNYKLGDRVSWGRSPCPCGRTLPVLQGIEGRADDLIVLPGGGLAIGLAVLEDLRVVPGVAQMQLVQEELRRFLVRAVAAPACDWAGARDRIAAGLRASLGHDIEVDVERVDAIPTGPGGKIRAVVSRCRP